MNKIEEERKKPSATTTTPTTVRIWLFWYIWSNRFLIQFQFNVFISILHLRDRDFSMCVCVCFSRIPPSSFIHRIMQFHGNDILAFQWDVHHIFSLSLRICQLVAMGNNWWRLNKDARCTFTYLQLVQLNDRISNYIHIIVLMVSDGGFFNDDRLWLFNLWNPT